MKPPLDLKPGDRVTTDFTGKITHHRITQRKENTKSQSQVMYRVTPWKHAYSWIDAAWFKALRQGQSDG